jgi:hypothetical protein
LLPKEAPLSPGGASAFPAFPVEKRAPVIVYERAKGFWEIPSEPNGVFSTRCHAMFRALDDHAAYSSLPMKFPKGDINARQRTLEKYPANYPDRRLVTHGRIRMGRFFVFIIIVSIALVLGMAFLVTYF